MKANELRIGNLLNYDTREKEGILPTIIDWQDIKWIEEKEEDFNQWNSPIPLTEEWLLNFGFEYSKFYNNYFAKNGDYFNSISYDVEGCEWNYNNDKSDAACYYVTSIKYVHQLQNLYFALTGEELQYEIK